MILFSGLFLFQFNAQAQQADHPFSVDLNLGGGLIGNPDVKTAFQPEVGFRYQPGRWGVGLESGFFSFDPTYNADQYRTGFERYTVVEESADRWNAFYINAGPRFRFGENLPVQFSAGLDLALSYKNPPSQRVDFHDPEGHFDDTQFTLANYEPDDGYSKWTAAVRPQLQLEFNPFRSNRIGFNLKTGIQHELSDREFTYRERNLEEVRFVDSAGEMFFQFENAPEVERTVSAPKTNFFANAGVKINFGGSGASTTRARSYFEGDQQRTAAESPNDDDRNTIDGVPVEITHQGRIQGESYQEDTDDIDINDDAIETAQDYNSSRSNKPNTEAALDDVVAVKMNGLTAADNFIDEIIDVLDRCEDEVCAQVRLNADGRKDKNHQVKQRQISQDQGIEDIHSIVMEDVVSLQRCETDVCRDVLTKEIQLLEHMNVLMSLVQTGKAAAAQDYNSSRSNKPTSRADDIGDDGGGDAGQQVVLITLDEDGKVYAWGGAPEAITQDENGKLYSWGRAQETGAGGVEGLVYSWGVASSASLRDGNGEVYCWGDNSRASLQDGSGNVYCWGGNTRLSADSCEGDSCPQQGDNTLYLAKELGLASAGDDIENIKQVLDRCDEGVCGQVRLNADKRHEGVRKAQDNPSEIDTHIEEIRDIVREDVESLARCETDVCREVLALEEQLLIKMNRLNGMARVAPANDYNSVRSNKRRSERSDGSGGEDLREAIRMASIINPAGVIISAGKVLASSNPDNPLYEKAPEVENPIFEGEAYSGDDDNSSDENQDSSTVQRYSLQPSSYCMQLGTNSQQGMRSDAQSHNSSRSNRTEGVANPDLDGDGFPEIMNNASFSMSKQSARAANDYNSVRSNKRRSEMSDDGDDAIDINDDAIETANDYNSVRSNKRRSEISGDGDDVIDINDEATRFHFELEIDDSGSDRGGIVSDQVLKTFFQTGDKPTASQADPLIDSMVNKLDDAQLSATYSISKRSARTGRDENKESLLAQESGSQDTPKLDSAPSDNVYQWSYDLKSLVDGGEFPAGTLTVLFTGGAWHFDMQFNPDSDLDGYGDLMQNSSFSISKRSARTGRNPQTGKEIR